MGFVNQAQQDIDLILLQYFLFTHKLINLFAFSDNLWVVVSWKNLFQYTILSDILLNIFMSERRVLNFPTKFRQDLDSSKLSLRNIW